MKKKIIILLICVFVIIIGYNVYQNYKVKHAKIEVTLISNLNIEFNSKVKLSDLVVSINGEFKDKNINTTKLGNKEISFNYINNDNIEVSYSFNINIVDTVAPLIFLNDTYFIEIGSKDTLINDIICGDNYDDNPICTIEGAYDLNKYGTYPLTFKAIDNSGNINTKRFELIVGNRPYNHYKSTYTYFNEVYDKYKTDDTLIGLDVSKYQGNIDFKKLKDNGVSFVMIRVGTEIKSTGEYILDPKFIQNITGAIENGIEVGIYFYSYATTKEEAIEDAKWVINNIKDYKVTFPVAFDWEDWEDFNNYNISFYNLTNIAYSYLDLLDKNGYDTYLYSSKYYLEKIWMNDKHKVWLAHYIDQTTYKGEYSMWQLCSDGIIDGIDGYVDIDVYYKNV